MRPAQHTIAEPSEHVASAEAIMLRFADRTGLLSGHPTRRYLWTDAFAVCNFLGLARATGRERYLALALELVDAVHAVLGHHRDDDPRSGWLSGLPEAEGAKRPTIGGLRIGKKLPERGPDQPLDRRLEWDRDGQYYHYLTKWMHALDQVAQHTGEAHYNRWARELAKRAHDAFLQRERGERGFLYWKMSIDLSRPLVGSAGAHDPLDGFVTAMQLRATANRLPSEPTGPDLRREIPSLAATIDPHTLPTMDPLGLGGLLMEACRIAQLGDGSLLRAVLASSIQGIRHFVASRELERPAERRLGFRELGLAIGLEGLAWIDPKGDSNLRSLLAELRRHARLGRAIEAFWSIPSHQDTPSWRSHRDINDVMLATSLMPRGFLDLSVGSR